MQKNPEINQKLLNYRNKHIEFRINYRNNLVFKLDLNTNSGFSHNTEFPPSKHQKKQSDILIAFYKSVTQLIYHYNCH